MNIHEKTIKFCPNCNSIDVEIDKTNPLQFSAGLPPRYVCNYCRYSSLNFPEAVPSKIKKIRDKRRQEKIQTHVTPADIRYGVFEVKVLWKIFGPLTILFGLFLIIYKPFSEFDPFQGYEIVLGILSIFLGAIATYITYFKLK